MEQPDDRIALDLMIRGFQVSRLIRLAADLGIADKVEPGQAMPVEALANATGSHAARLIRILRALAAFGIFRVGPDGAVAHSPRSLLLRRDTPGTLHHAARHWAAPGSWGAWGRLDVAPQGGTPHQAAWGTSRFEYLAAHPEEARLFDAAMAGFNDHRHDAIAAACDLSGVSTIVDVGGGNGEALRQILARAPDARGILFDRAHVVGAIPPGNLLDGRITVAAGSFFEAVPPGGDLYLIGRVLHDWSDEDCRRILASCRAAMGPSARLLVVEALLDPDPAQGEVSLYLVDMQMMAMFGDARERTEAEFDALLTASGFVRRRTIPTETRAFILEALPG
jgi:hypothetical protein